MKCVNAVTEVLINIRLLKYISCHLLELETLSFCVFNRTLSMLVHCNHVYNTLKVLNCIILFSTSKILKRNVFLTSNIVECVKKMFHEQIQSIFHCYFSFHKMPGPTFNSFGNVKEHRHQTS